MTAILLYPSHSYVRIFHLLVVKLLIYIALQENQYVRAIKSVGSILACYDHDQLFPVFGFGARVPHKFQGVSHCFPLNFNNEEPEVKGIQVCVSVVSSVCVRARTA